MGRDLRGEGQWLRVSPVPPVVLARDIYFGDRTVHGTSGCFLHLAYSAETSQNSWVYPSPGARPAAVSCESIWGWPCLPFLLGESVN